MGREDFTISSARQSATSPATTNTSPQHGCHAAAGDARISAARCARNAAGWARVFASLSVPPMLKLTTWNVNGVRAREREVLDLIEQERPDVLCLQEVKAAPEQLPEALAGLSGYHTYWHGQKGYSGVALHLSQETFPRRPAYGHPEFDHESRIVTARAGDVG